LNKATFDKISRLRLGKPEQFSPYRLAGCQTQVIIPASRREALRIFYGKG